MKEAPYLACVTDCNNSVLFSKREHLQEVKIMIKGNFKILFAAWHHLEEHKYHNGKAVVVECGNVDIIQALLKYLGKHLNRCSIRHFMLASRAAREEKRRKQVND